MSIQYFILLVHPILHVSCASNISFSSCIQYFVILVHPIFHVSCGSNISYLLCIQYFVILVHPISHSQLYECRSLCKFFYSYTFLLSTLTTCRKIISLIQAQGGRVVGTPNDRSTQIIVGNKRRLFFLL